MASHQGIHPNAPPHDKQDEAKDRTRGWRAVPLVASPRRASLSRCPVLLVVSVAVPPHIARRGFPSRGGVNSRGGHIFRAVFLSSSYPPWLIASSVPRLSVPSGQASRQGKTAGGHRRFSPPSSYPSPVSSSPRLAPRVGLRGERRLAHRRSARLAVPVAPSRSGARHRRRLGPAAITASKQSGRPVLVPPLVSAGVKPSAPLPYRFSWPRHRHGWQASKTAAVLVPSARLDPITSASSAHRLIRLVPHVG